MSKILITGNMRSGTSFLANFLNGQENITIFRDSFHALAGKMLGQPTNLVKLDYKAKLEEKEKMYIMDKIQYGFRMLGNIVNYNLNLKLSDFDTLEELYYILMNSIAKKNDKVVGHKVTECEINVENIITQTDIKVIYIIRDPRDVVISSVKKFNQPLEHYLNGWMKRVGIIDTLIEKNAMNNNLMCVKYEDLIYQSSEVLDQLSEFIGAEITYDIRTLKDFDNDWGNNSSYGDVNSLYDTNAVYRWKHNYSEDVQKIENETIDYLKKYGYQIGLDIENSSEEIEILEVTTENEDEIESLELDLEVEENIEKQDVAEALHVEEYSMSSDEITKYLEDINKKLSGLIAENKMMIKNVKKLSK